MEISCFSRNSIVNVNSMKQLNLIKCLYQIFFQDHRSINFIITLSTINFCTDSTFDWLILNSLFLTKHWFRKKGEERFDI